MSILLMVSNQWIVTCTQYTHTETTKDQSKSSPLPVFPVFLPFDVVICCTDASEAHLVSVFLSLCLYN